MKNLLIIFFLLGLTYSCEKTSVHDVDLIGYWKWIEYHDFDSGITFEFKDSETLNIHESNSFSSYEYELFRDNTIQIEYGTRIARNEVVVYSKDSIEILGFTISGIPEAYSTVLKRVSRK